MLSALFLGLLAAAGGDAGVLVPEPCRFPVAAELEARTRCYRLSVPRSYERPGEGAFELAVAVQKAAVPVPGRRPLLVLHGGPGGRGAVAGFGRVRDPFAAGVDTITFDQRGNGLSQPTLCADIKSTTREAIAGSGDALSTAWRMNEPYARCRARFAGAGIRPEHFGTRVTTLDAERLRRALGIARWDIISVSYGTMVALDMMAANPGSIGSVVLDSPVGLVPDARTEAAAFEQPVLNLFAACAAQPACNGAYPRLAEDYRATFAMLDAEPLAMALDPAATGGIPQADINGIELEYLLRRLMRSSAGLGSIPRILQAARARDVAPIRPLVQAALAVVPEDNSLGRPAIMCHDIPELHAVSPPVRAIDLGQLFGICPIWGAAGPGPRFPGRARSDVLMLVGALDPLYEPALVRSIQARLGPKARLALFPAATHAVWSPGCAQRIVAAFFAAPSAAPDTACIAGMPPIDFLVGGPAGNGAPAPAAGGPHP